MMILEVVAAGGCNSVELMIGQRMTELSAGCCEGIVKAVVRIVHLIDFEHRFQASFIETGIMGHEGDGRYVVAEIIN